MVMQTTGQQPSAGRHADKTDCADGVGAEAAKKKALKQAKLSEERIEEFLREGMFYHALAEFIVDLPIFPFAFLKGPMVKIVPEIKWPPGGGQPTCSRLPKMFWTGYRRSTSGGRPVSPTLPMPT